MRIQLTCHEQKCSSLIHVVFTHFPHAVSETEFMSHWIDSSSKFKWDCAHVGIRHIKEGSVVLKPLLWTNSSLVPSLFLSVPTYFTRSPCKVSSAFLTSTSNSTPLDSGQYRGEFWSFLLPFWLRAMALFPFEEQKKKTACYLKTLQLVSLARLLLKYRPASQLLFNSVFPRGFKTRFTSKNSHCLEIPKSLRALDGTRPLVFDSPRSFHEQNEIS